MVLEHRLEFGAGPVELALRGPHRPGRRVRQDGLRQPAEITGGGGAARRVRALLRPRQPAPLDQDHGQDGVGEHAHQVQRRLALYRLFQWSHGRRVVAGQVVAEAERRPGQRVVRRCRVGFDPGGCHRGLAHHRKAVEAERGPQQGRGGPQ